MQGYKHHKAYIIAQNPLPLTVRNFWKVICDRKCAVVVMLSQLKENGEVQHSFKFNKSYTVLNP